MRAVACMEVRISSDDFASTELRPSCFDDQIACAADGQQWTLNYVRDWLSG